MNPDRKRLLIVVAIAMVAALVYFWLQRTPTLTSQDLIADAYQTCLDLGHTAEECEGTN